MLVYINRNPKAGFSIGKVFSTIIDEAQKYTEVNKIQLPYYGASFVVLIKNILYVLSRCKSNHIYHITGDVHYILLGLIGKKTVLTIHDCVFLESEKNRLKFYVKKILWLYLPIKIATVVTCISDKTKNEINKYIKCKKEINVVYNPVDSIYLTKYEINKTKSEQVRILHLGTKVNKNLERVIKALEGINCQLHIVGKINENIKLQLKESNLKFQQYQNLNENELLEQYRWADIVSFPSTYEGFGMPIIEGQAMGCAILTSNIAPMTEVGGNSVLYVNPFDVDSISDGFKQLIYDQKLRNTLVDRGYENVKRFMPSVIAKQYIDIYNKMINKNN